MTRRHTTAILFAVLYLMQIALLVYWHILSSAAGRQVSVLLTVLTAMLAGIVDVACAALLQRAIDQTEKAHAARSAEELERSLQAYRDMAEHEARMVANISRAIEQELALAEEVLSCGEVDDAYAHMQAGLDMASGAYSLQHENVVMAAVLEAQKRQCDSKGIELDAKVALPAELGIPDIELATLVFSLIDFARENCEQVRRSNNDKCVINVRMLTELGQLVVEVEGPVARRRLARRREGDQALQSDGNIAIVREMAERYGGIVDMENDGKVSRVSVMLPMGGDVARG